MSDHLQRTEKDVAKKTSRLAIASLVLALSCIGSWLGVILGFFSILKIRDDKGLKGTAFGVAAIIIGMVITLIALPFSGGLLFRTILSLGSLLPEHQKNEISARTNLSMFHFEQGLKLKYGYVDQDGDGVLEYNFLQELAEMAPPRATGPKHPYYHMPHETFEAKKYGKVSADGIATTEGYHYRAYLPSASGTPIGETNPLPAPNAADADLQEKAFIFYAWPATAGTGGQKCFVINQEGIIYSMENFDASGIPVYDGLEKIPEATAALLKDHEDAKNLAAPFPDPARGEVGNDGHVWKKMRQIHDD